MNKKINKKLKNRAIVATMMVSMVALGVLGGNTYSKYIAQIDGTGNAEIARWAFKANNETKTIANIKLSNTYNQSKIVENTIAPGTSGSFDIILDTTGSDVAIDYAIKFENSANKPTNLKFRYGETTSDTLEGLEEVLKGRINVDDERTKTITINWDWQYQTGTTSDEIAENDRKDTEDAGKNYTFDVTITGTQVNPSESV